MLGHHSPRGYGEDVNPPRKGEDVHPPLHQVPVANGRLLNLRVLAILLVS